MRIYLTGHRTFGNRGCEAIVRSTVAGLNSIFSDVTVLVPSDDIERDSRQWQGATQSGVEFVPAYMPRYSRYWVHAQRLPVSWFKRAGWPFSFPEEFRAQLGSVDAVLSIGGDNYSLDYRLPSLLQGVDGLAMKLNKPVILWGASVGPFDREPHFMAAIRAHLNRMTRIMVRESVSYHYLADKFKLENVTQMVDPAFGLACEEIDCTSFWPKDDGRLVIGLNLSPLLERYKSADQDLMKEIEKFVRKTVVELGHGILFVPHVIPLNGVEKNNDAAYMQQILERCSDLGSYVQMAPRELNAAQLKYVISRLRFFIGARTHATIAALSTGIPTISIAYSIKARGINRDLFGNEDVVLPAPLVSAESLMSKLDYLVENEEMLHQTLLSRTLEYQTLIRNALLGLADLLVDTRTALAT